MWRIGLALLLFWVSLPGGSNADYRSAKQKFSRIENDLVAPGSRVSITSHELNAWVRRQVPSVVPDGLRDPRLELGHGSATGSALVNFVKLRSAKGYSTNWLLRIMLEGEKQVRVTARIRSGSGRATVDVERVEISGMAISGGALDFLIRNFLLPYYPDAKVGVPFELGHRIERLELEPTGVGVLIED